MLQYLSFDCKLQFRSLLFSLYQEYHFILSSLSILEILTVVLFGASKYLELKILTALAFKYFEKYFFKVLPNFYHNMMEKLVTNKTLS